MAFAALGAAMLKSSPLGGGVVLALSVPVWAAGRRLPRPGAAPRRLFVVSATVVIIALVALAVALLGPGPASLGELVHGR